eukprot:scaffold4923_cov238-Pinguiococcus_pyrenoidosus.AAC.2
MFSSADRQISMFPMLVVAILASAATAPSLARRSSKPHAAPKLHSTRAQSCLTCLVPLLLSVTSAATLPGAPSAARMLGSVLRCFRAVPQQLMIWRSRSRARRNRRSMAPWASMSCLLASLADMVANAMAKRRFRCSFASSRELSCLLGSSISIAKSWLSPCKAPS